MQNVVNAFFLSLSKPNVFKPMKRLLLVALLAFISISGFSQNSGALKFLGIPIDGSQAQFTASLKAKGFSYNARTESYQGQFNGKDVDVYIHTNHNLVDRVYVAFPLNSEDNVRVEYNTLLSQFRKTKKYVELFPNEAIPEEENLMYEITVNSKRYEAGFYYYAPDKSPQQLKDEWLDAASENFPAEQVEEMKRVLELPDDEWQAYFGKIIAALDSEDVVIDEDAVKDRIGLFLSTMHSMADGSVWFMIHEQYGKYRIGLYYDNLHNQANGEDL